MRKEAENLFLCPTIILTIFQSCTNEIDIAHQEAVIGLVKNTYFACIVQFSFLRLFRSKSIYGLIGEFVSYVMLLGFRIARKFAVDNFISFPNDDNLRHKTFEPHPLTFHCKTTWIFMTISLCSYFMFSFCLQKYKRKSFASRSLADDAPPDMNIKGGRSSTK